jgi:hypothetical protein
MRGSPAEARIDAMPGPTLAILLDLTSFGIVVIGVTLLLIMVTALHRPPTRPCHQCGRRVRITARTCIYCGYEFSPVRFHR